MSRPIALLLPGQGSQHAGMATGLYRTHPVFTAAMDEVFAAMGEEGARLRADWLARQPAVALDHVTRAQPLLFAIDYALGQVVFDWGLRPETLLGHSIGELAGATLAGVFGLGDAARLVLDRMHRLADGPPGGMLAVAARQEDVTPFLDGDVVIGAVNAPRQIVLAGPYPALALVEKSLLAQDFTCRRVPSLSPFHSPALAPATEGAAEVIATLPVSPPRITLYSCYTAAPLTYEDVADANYWARHPVAMIRFWPALDALLAERDAVLVEAGPGQGLSQLARRHPAVRAGRSAVVSLLPGRPGPPDRDRSALATAAKSLGVEGLTGL
ncbi:polyketide synthase [Prauserella marina]|uniref:Acyl transferase domain-containing protein n=1 Tax=Prauserella marina TaxID=530584 RepID=A0A222VYS3_9PSEU|nr:acyltransferase domain-containing protein [Prauserella marina]ASR39077.1 polyketide synthase [Prauserella marina]PWV85398.1 acyl transferase family protein [Prauserella marina]SDC55797.1 Acyl transferase domain-containing protein [Prauserella marina]